MTTFLAQERKPGDFRLDNEPMNPDVYTEEVRKLFSSPIVQNEIHKLLNKAADKLVRHARTLEEIAFIRGELDLGDQLLKLATRQPDRVHIPGEE